MVFDLGSGGGGGTGTGGVTGACLIMAGSGAASRGRRKYLNRCWPATIVGWLRSVMSMGFFMSG
eukprot:CAMPEP_0202879636 /NCGR_PEP_ID=MMETSP1391-20130828/33910_1 /ASSEMBLY_ACC=CAM_ASM_000867 /TAXON_ID=1034604 /ORGANISM="Chlamydomonas leiostraca, Strain SAG 11-49" /LENGTH=63 /DNA_ID=CAMNT_0049562025 /DNA_START=53 /DNA_END=244 /DNA_ORIENTATION=+